MPGELTTAVREKPFALLLFDELERLISKSLIYSFKFLDEGFVTDGSGRKVMFTNTIIIATSNAGSNLIRESIKGGGEYDKVGKQLIDYGKPKYLSPRIFEQILRTHSFLSSFSD